MPQSQRKPLPKNNGNGPNLKVLYGILGLVALLGGGWIVYSVKGGGAAAIEPIELADVASSQELLAMATGIAAGAESGVQVLVFSDFTCPACQGWAGFIEPQLKAEYISTNRIKYVYYDFPLGGTDHPWGFIAARAARCANDQDKFWEYHDVLFARQNEWAISRTPPIDQLVDYGELINLGMNAFESCVRSDEHADVVTANRMLGDRLGVGATPTIFIGSRSIPDWRNYDEVKKAIEAELGAGATQ
ncbi:MAG: DsbA family protein [Longimicrobiales bacterium]